MTNLFRKRQTVIVAHHLTTPGKVTTVGTIARVTGHHRIGTVVLTSIETFDHKTWNVPESYIVKAPRPWSAYQKVGGRFDNSLELAAIAEAEARQAAAR
jgi:hypothetical protein